MTKRGLLKNIRSRAFAPLAVIITAMFAVPCLAGNAPYYTMTWEAVYGETRTQDAFLPGTVIEKFGETDLKSPSDIAISRDGHIYIADTGNKRVIKCLQDGTPVREYGDGLLEQPTGVHVNAQNDLYVADTKNKAVYMFSDAGELLREYLRPTSFLYGEANNFAPKKVAADETGNVYVISDGNTNGVIQLSKEGEFFGYVGANTTGLYLRELIQRLTFTEAQKDQLKRNVPITPFNLCTDDRGLVYTVTQGGASDALKKFNLASQNMLYDDLYWVDAVLSAVCVGTIENIFTLSQNGYIFEYDREGSLLFVFSGRDEGYNRDGLFTNAVGIASDREGNIYVLDADQRRVTKFVETEFGATVHRALSLYQSGRYLESKEPWENALRQDTQLNWAHWGVGEAYYKMEDYGSAMRSFRYAYNGTGYSNSFWEVRNDWLMDNLPYIFIGIIALFILVKAIKRLNRKTKIFEPIKKIASKVTERKLVKQISYMARFPRNPAEAFYGLKFEGKTSVMSATIIYFLFFAMFLVNKYASGFLFKNVPDNYFEISNDMIMVFGVIGTVVVCNYLVSAIRDGEATLRQVYMAFAYCLTPYILIKPFVFILTHVLTANESFLVSFGNFFIVAAAALLIVIMVKEIQDYTYGGAVRCLLLTAFTTAMLLITAAIVFALINQVMDFVYAVVMEVYFRAS